MDGIKKKRKKERNDGRTEETKHKRKKEQKDRNEQ